MNYLYQILFLLLVLIVSSHTLSSDENINNQPDVVDELVLGDEIASVAGESNPIYNEVLDWLGELGIKLGLISPWSLAIAYEEGNFVEQDYQKAFNLFLSQAQQGRNEAQYAVGYYYANGWAVSKNIATAVAWYKLAALAGLPWAQRELARILMSEEEYGLDYDTAFYWASSAAELGDLDAQILLAILYENGTGVAVDKTQAFYLRLNAAEQGWVNAGYLVGLSYEFGLGVKRDYTKAFNWYQFAKDNGHIYAQYYLGYAYLKGLGVEQSYPKGFALIQQTAEQGLVLAQQHMGEIYLEGIVQTNNDLLAVKWFERAIKNGSIDAQVALALLYLNGRGVEQNLDKSLNLLNLAAAQKSARGAYILGRIYTDNLWLPKNLELGLSWLTKAADLDHIQGMKSLIELYNVKNSALYDKEKAHFWLEKMQNSSEERHNFAWAQVALEVIKDADVSLIVFNFLMEAKNNNIPAAFGELSWLYRTGLGDYFGVLENEELAIELAKEGVSLLDINSFYQYGIMQEFGTKSMPINYLLAVEMYEQAVILGSISAKFRLGLLYLDGKGVVKNIDYALNLIEGAAKAGLEEAYVFLGWLYEHGYYISQDLAVAESFYMAAAEHGDEVGQFRLSVLFRQSEVPDLKKEGLIWLKKAAQAGHSEAQFELSLFLSSQASEEERVEAVKWAEYSSKVGNPRGISMLAWLLGEGIGTLKDVREARSLFAQSASMGDPYSQFRLGKMLHEGNPTTEDKERGLELLVKSCDAGIEEACRYLHHKKSLDDLYQVALQGDKNAQYTLGGELGRGVLMPRDYAQSLKWYRLAAEQGHAKAQNEVGRIYDNALGVEQDVVAAFDWFRLSAEQGYDIAQHNLGLLYFNGRGTPQNYVNAHYWYQKAVDQGHALAQNDLGYLNQRGLGVELNLDEALRLYTFSAEQGYSVAQHNLGVMYENGFGTAQNYAEAFNWYKKAAEQGNRHAQNSLGNMYQYGKGVIKNLKEAEKWHQLAAKQGDPNSAKRLKIKTQRYQDRLLCHPIEPEVITKSCDLFNLSNALKDEYNQFFMHSLGAILDNYTMPEGGHDGNEYDGKIKFCLSKDGEFTHVQLTQPSGHKGLDQAMLNAIHLTHELTLPKDPCLKKKAYFIRTTLVFDETDLVN